MTLFRVWAPRAHSVALSLGDEQMPMSLDEGSWWSADLPGARDGQDYAFCVDDGAPLPDPRSPWQPNGVHAPSRLVDHASFPWTDASWQPRALSSAVIYELHVGTFTARGTFESAIARLYSIAVVPAMSGKGLGKLLLKAAERVARRRGCDTIRLEVHETNHAAIARYRKQGYQEFGRHRRYYDDGGDALRFHKKLVRG